uniref:Uncharacterized protein n=1 Tax=Avena sativa TaxID=4498 RepID=A0ACD5TNZ6_AVESA
MRTMISAYHEDNDDNEFKFIHVFTRIKGCDKCAKTRTSLAKANSSNYDPGAAPSAVSEGRPVGHRKAKAMRDAAPATKKLHSSILACMADAPTHTDMRAEQATRLEEISATRWASVIERQDIKLGLIKANVVAKKRREDLAILMVDTKDMDSEVRAWCVDRRALILSENRATANQNNSPTPATATPTPTPIYTQASTTVPPLATPEVPPSAADDPLPV